MKDHLLGARRTCVILVGALWFCLIGSGVTPAANPPPTAVEARRLATALSQAATEQETEVVIQQILSRLGVPILRGDDDLRAAQGRGIFPIEIKMIARSFRSGTLMPLDNLADMWSQDGLICEGGPCTGATVEKALRRLRQAAEQDPNNEEWLLILLVDALANRRESPFRLLGPCDQTCLESSHRSAAPGTAYSQKPTAGQTIDVLGSSSFQSSFMAEAMKATLEDEDDKDVSQMMEALLASGGMEGLLAALAKGDFVNAMAPVLEQAGIDPGAVQKAQAESEQAMSQLPPEVRAQMQAMGLQTNQTSSSSSFPKVDDLDQGLENTRQLRDQMKNSWETLRVEAQKAYTQRKPDLSGPDDVEGLFDLGLGFLESTFYADMHLEPMYFDANWVVDRAEEIQESLKRDDDRHLIGLPGPTKEPTSCLQLDPVQVMLLALDLVGLREMDEGGDRP